MRWLGNYYMTFDPYNSIKLYAKENKHHNNKHNTFYIVGIEIT